jgi:hypothetical protein
MKVHVASLAAALIVTVVGGLTLAQPAAAPTPPILQYQVEIIVFAHREFDAGEERFSQELAPLRADRNESLLAVPLYVEPSPPVTPDPAVGAAEGATAAGGDPLAFRVLPPDQLQLNAEYRKLTNGGAYRPVLHAGWVQPGLPEDQAKPFDLTLLGVTNPRGNVRVYLSRFLHVRLDLSYQDGAKAAAPTAEPPGNELREITFAPQYRLVTERQTRSGELHYFDHPAFGVLVKVTPVPAGNTGSTGRRPAA